MNKQQLAQLREQLLTEITPLVIDTAGDGGDRFSLLLRIIQSGRADEKVYARAYDTAKLIEDPSERLDALMTLLDEVEVDLNTAEDTESDVEAVSPERHDEQPSQDQEQPQQEQPQEYSEQHENNEQHQQ